MRHVLQFVLLAIVLVACDDRGITVTAENAQFAVVGGPPVHQVLGGGSIVREDIEGAPREIYGFQAQVDADGNAWGEAEVHFPSNDVKMHIAVRCLAIERNQAWLSGEVTRSDDPETPVGRVFVWQVRDNGEGGDAPPDRISNFFYLETGNYEPDACREKTPRPTYRWDNGNVRILTPGGPSLADLVGTWDATVLTYYRLPDLGDTLDALAGDGEARWTVAPGGNFSLIWWAPGVIFENVAGVVDVVNGQMIQTFYEAPAAVIVPDPRVTGSTVTVQADLEFGADWDGDGEDDDPSRIVMEWRKKRTGVLIDDLAGAWDATVWRYTSTADPTTMVDLVADLGLSVTVTVTRDSRLYFVIEPGGWTSTTDELLIDGNQMLVRNGGESQSFVFSLEDDTWSLAGLNEFDFDQDGTQDEAMLEAVVVRH
ncbi:MAG: hypothetical protein OEY20_14040 [Gemmatimonadota bacterium]|nr:hypothetical protein [Gemmatimonadota bacterium]